MDHAADPTSPESSSRQRTAAVILIVEDGAATREVWAAALRDAGFRVLTADSKAAGLALLRDRRHVDVVLTDYWLGDGHGESLLREAAAEGLMRDVGALICTAHLSVDSSSYAPVIHKPIEAGRLVATVRAVLAGLP